MTRESGLITHLGKALRALGWERAFLCTHLLHVPGPWCAQTILKWFIVQLCWVTLKTQRKCWDASGKESMMWPGSLFSEAVNTVQAGRKEITNFRTHSRTWRQWSKWDSPFLNFHPFSILGQADCVKCLINQEIGFLPAFCELLMQRRRIPLLRK